ncbi:efflux RND transporter periplasmic adaptor subunit [Maribacter aquivivus]|uniref:efflux RND transporter periplasmic adaptor subunit n=1 Tax=Maribacter aquivivus TaxID=228958 RepID=UPI002493734C|nr:efflux RND transporter periplasmic adaptor subunit [Maribacter aquivivus]
MKKNILYLVIAAVLGLLCGYLIFGNDSDSTNAEVSNDHNHSEVSTNEMWTCSMHPQIMLPEFGNCPICGMDLIPADVGGEVLAVNEIKMTANAMALANIETTIVGNLTDGDTNRIISLSGKIAVNKETNAVQASYFDGRLERLNVNYEGQKVKRGQLLASIYAPNLVAAQQELLTTASLKESQPALYNAVRNKLKLWKLSESQINAIESSGKVRDNFSIYATVSGTVSGLMAKEGDYVKQGQPILEVTNLNSVWAEFDAYENQISNLKVGQKIKVLTNAFAKEFEATISFIDPMLNNAKRTVTVRAILKNTEHLFKPGMFVTGKLTREVDVNDEMITVPSSAVMWTGERSLVYVKTNPNEPVFEMREVTIGNRNEENFTISKGLQNGDEIVTNGTFTMDAAAQLQGKKSMMNKTGGKTMTGHEHHKGMELNSGEIESSQMMKMEFPKTFQKNFSKSLSEYLKMKDAFVAGNTTQVASMAKESSSRFKTLSVENLGKMELAHVQKSIEMFNAIGNSVDIEEQRNYLVILNENVVAIAMELHSPSETLYVQECPMANDNKGAKWLSMEKEIRNPYYDSAMLTCGSVINVIQ